jgi:micrococcal nuclease
MTPDIHDSLRRRRATLLLAAGLLVVLFVAGRWALQTIGDPEASRPPGTATVVRVVDGDTLVVDVGGREEHVRLIGIDTPESVAPNRPKECFGDEASARLGELVPPGTDVRLVRDVEPRDMYDRMLAYVERLGDDLHVNLAQVAEGYAIAKDYPPNSAHRDQLGRAERSARAAGLGLWAACGGADTPLDGPGP